MMEEQRQEPEKNIILTRDKHIITIFNKKLNKSLRYDLINMQMQRLNKITNSWEKVEKQYHFFDGMSINSIYCEEEHFKKLIEKTEELNPSCSSLSTFISRMNQALIYENYIRQGIKTQCSVYKRNDKRILTKPIEFYSRNTIKFFKECDIEVTVNLEKAFIQDYNYMENIVELINSSNLNRSEKKECMEEVVRQNYDWNPVLKTLIKEYRYEPKALFEYVFGYLVPFENLRIGEALRLLKDYYSMASAIGRNVKKYPKYLKSMHDIITSNFNAFKKNYDEQLFTNLIKKELEFEGKEYSIVVPKCSKDIIKEGTDNNHCVGSYVDRILRCETYIMFLRNTQNKDCSLVTLEYRNNSIIQAKGSYNRQINDSERKFLENYCKKLNITLSV